MSKGGLATTKTPSAGEYRYIDFTISTATATGNETLVPASINQTQIIPYLEKPADYEVTVVSLRMPLFTVPLFIFEDGNYNIGLYIQDLAANEVPSNFHVYPVVYEGSGLSNPVPPYFGSGASFPQDRAVYYPSQFIAMVNQAYANVGRMQLEMPLDAEYLPGLTAADYPFFQVPPGQATAGMNLVHQSPGPREPILAPFTQTRPL